MTAPPILQTERPRLIAIPYDVLLTVAILLVAFGLRAVRLGDAPLDPYESGQAVAAMKVFRPEWPGDGQIASPVTHLLAVGAFAVAGPTEGALRFGAMLAGLGLVAAPLLFRQRLGYPAALIASAWLAVSPVAVGASRRMGGATLSMLALLLAAAALDRWVTVRQRGSMAAAGALLGVALVADYGTLAILFAMAVGGFFAFLTDEVDEPTPERLSAALGGLPWPVILRTAGAAALLLATAFFALPGGLGAAADLLSRFLAGVTQRVPGVTTPALALPLYHPALLIFGLIGAWRLTQSPTGWQRFLADWAVVALMTTVLIYQGVRPEHMLWTVVPFAGLAGLTVQQMLTRPYDGPRWGPWALGLATAGLAAMLFANLSQYLLGLHRFVMPAGTPLGLAGASIPLDLILGGLWLLLLAVLWFGAASLWGVRTAWRGLALGVLMVGLATAAGQAASLAFDRPSSPYEPMNVVPGQPELPLLIETAHDISAVSTGSGIDAGITLQSWPDRPLSWALRDFEDVHYTAAATPRVATPLVITPASGADPALGSAYVGQDFVVTRSWTPRGLKLGDMLRWALYRTAPTLPGEERVILWLRDDVFRLLDHEIAPTN